MQKIKWTLYFIDKSKMFYRISEGPVKIVQVLLNDEWRNSQYNEVDIVKNQEAYNLGEF